MSKILILANHYNTLRIFRRELIKKLAELGNEVFISIPACSQENVSILESYGSKVFITEMDRRGMNPVKDMALMKKYKKLVREIKPDMVIAFTIKCNIYGGYVCKREKISFFANITGLGSTFQGNGKSRKIVSFMYKHSLDKAEKVFFENIGNRDTLVNDGIIKKEQTIVMHGAGVNLDEFPCYEYPTDEDGIRFLYVGRIMQEKGVDELFEAIDVVCEQYTNVRFVFIGWYEDNYKEKVEKLENKGYIEFEGWQADVRPFYKDCHCVIHPSWHEGMSNTLLEASSCGRPVITNKIHGCMEAVDDGINGFLCKKGDKENLTKKIRMMLELSNSQRAEMGKLGRKKMEREFDKNDVVSKTIETILGKS